MNRHARILFVTLIIGLVVCKLAATEQAQRYIVILKQRAGAAPDIASLGGVIESRQDEQLVITIPIGSLAALKADPKVRYIERAGGQPSAAEDVLIGEPSDPQPGLQSQSKRLVPHTLGSTPWNSGTYAYDGAGDIIAIGTDNYLYDGAQRLKQSSTKGTGETYTYDGFGNMKTRTNTTIPPVDATTNRYMGYSYNEIGAVTSDGLYGFSYDALGQPLSKTYPNKDPEYYLYTASDERIGVQRGGWWTWSVRDQSGKVLRQYKSSVTNPSAPSLWLEDYIWRDGLLLGSQRPVEMGGRRHFHLDHLGTPRLVTSDNGQRVSSHDYYPFGDEQTNVTQEGPAAGGFDREEPLKFTGHERDYAGGMGGEDGHAVDYMHARYYGSGVGRFLSVDPTWDNADTGKPQSWNRYSYVLNNPVRYTDPDGRCTDVFTCTLEGFSVGNVPGAAIGATLGVVIAYGVTNPNEVAALGNNMGGGSGGERFAENWIRQNNANHMAEKQEQEKGTAGGDRAGKPFTPKGKQEIHDRNAQQNGGENRCQNCDRKVDPGKKSEKGVTPPGNERQADHKIPKSKGGDGSPSNGQTLCRDCNLDKKDTMPPQ